MLLSLSHHTDMIWSVTIYHLFTGLLSHGSHVQYVVINLLNLLPLITFQLSQSCFLCAHENWWTENHLMCLTGSLALSLFLILTPSSSLCFSSAGGINDLMWDLPFTTPTSCNRICNNNSWRGTTRCSFSARCSWAHGNLMMLPGKQTSDTLTTYQFQLHLSIHMLCMCRIPVRVRHTSTFGECW